HGQPNDADTCIDVCAVAANMTFTNCMGNELLGVGGTDNNGNFKQGSTLGIGLNRPLQISDVVCVFDTCNPQQPGSCAIVTAPAPAPALTGRWLGIGIGILALVGLIGLKRVGSPAR